MSLVFQFFPDIDECTVGTDNCDDFTGLCHNTVGSYDCSCQPGYTGPGTIGSCDGRHNVLLTYEGLRGKVV